MPLYFFNARGPTRYVADTKGIELDNMQAAYDVAIQIVHDITGGRLGFPEASDWTIEISDQDNEAILALSFVDAFKPASEQT